MYACTQVFSLSISNSQADSASTLDRVTELEEQLRTAQQEKDLLNEMLQQSKVGCVQLATAYSVCCGFNTCGF